MDLGNPGKWRKSKVESFIRRHLSVFDLGMTRYYEMCMWDNKGTLLPSYAILMDKSIVLTENPPKSIIYTIPLSRIQDISLIADRHSLIKGKNNNSYVCQHISIVYESLKNKKGKNNYRPNNKMELVPETNDDHDNVHNNISLPNSSFKNMNEEDEQRSNSSQTDLSVVHSNYSDVSVSPVPSFLEASFKSSVILSAYEPTITQVNENGYAWLKALDGGDSGLGETFSNSPSASHTSHSAKTRATFSQLTFDEWITKHSTHQRSLTEERKKRLMTNLNSVNNVTDKIYSPKRESKDSRLNQSNLSNNHPLTEGHQTNLLNNRRRRTTSSRTKVSNNSIVSENNTSGEQRVNKRNKENEDKPLMRGTVRPSKKMEDLQLYFYQRDSEFLNELSLVWNRQQLKNTEKQEEEAEEEDSPRHNGAILAVNKSLRAAEKVVARVAQDWTYLEDLDRSHRRNRLSKDSPSNYHSILRKLVFLHKCLMRYEQLKYLCWKNSEIISGLLNALTSCWEHFGSSNKHTSVDMRDAYFDKLAVYAIVMDIFRTLYEACNVSWFKETESITQNNDFYHKENLNEWETETWDLKLNIAEVTRILVSSILKSPLLPSSNNAYSNEGCFLAVTGSQKFEEPPWLILGEEHAAKMARLICSAHNASSALLSELLAISHFLPTLMEKTIVTSGVQETNVERFIRLSVTQIINILWSNRDPMTASETMILYRQVWNLINLARHDRRILQFMRRNFFEEFHYYVRSKGVKSRIPDQYTIKSKVIDACEKLCEDIIGKPWNKS